MERMLPSWVDGASLDRINTDGHYEYGNLRWSTINEQNRNKRNNMVIEYRGRSMNLSSWAKELQITSAALAKRFKSWSIEQALTTPKKGSK